MAAAQPFLFPGHYPFCVDRELTSSTIDRLEDSMLLWWLTKSATFTLQASTVQNCGAGGIKTSTHSRTFNFNWNTEPIKRICYPDGTAPGADQTGDMFMEPGRVGDNRGCLYFIGEIGVPAQEVDQCSPGDIKYLFLIFQIGTELTDYNLASTSSSFSVALRPGRTVDLLAGVFWDPYLQPTTVSIDSFTGSVELWEPS